MPLIIFCRSIKSPLNFWCFRGNNSSVSNLSLLLTPSDPWIHGLLHLYSPGGIVWHFLHFSRHLAAEWDIDLVPECILRSSIKPSARCYWWDLIEHHLPSCTYFLLQPTSSFLSPDRAAWDADGEELGVSLGSIAFFSWTRSFLSWTSRASNGQ